MNSGGALRGGPCKVPACPGRTTGGKPYCLDHIHRNPYVREQLGHLPGVQERRERERKAEGSDAA